MIDACGRRSSTDTERWRSSHSDHGNGDRQADGNPHYQPPPISLNGATAGYQCFSIPQYRYLYHAGQSDGVILLIPIAAAKRNHQHELTDSKIALRLKSLLKQLVEL